MKDEATHCLIVGVPNYRTFEKESDQNRAKKEAEKIAQRLVQKASIGYFTVPPIHPMTVLKKEEFNISTGEMLKRHREVVRKKN